MSKEARSNSLRQRLLVAYHEDGLLDLVVGLAVLMLAAVFAFDWAAFIGLLAIPLVMYIPLKQQIAFPRSGFIRFESEQKTRSLLGVLLAFGVLTFLLFALFSGFLASAVGSLESSLPYIFAALFAVILAGVGYFMSNPRFYAYAVSGLVLVSAAQGLALPLWGALGLLALVMLAVAVYYLSAFLRNYPLPQE